MTGPDAAEISVSVPKKFVAVTPRRRYCPTWLGVASKLSVVAPEIGMQSAGTVALEPPADEHAYH